MQSDIINIKMEFNEPLLGSASGNPELHEEFIARKFTEDKEKAAKIAAHDDPAKATKEHIAEEVKAVTELPEDAEEAMVKAMTVFPRDEQGLFLWDYQIRGFFKETIRVLIDLGEESVKGITAYSHKRAVDKFLFVEPRRVYLMDLTGRDTWKEAPDALTRPLRATTMRGDRIALATSEIVPAGTSCQFQVRLLQCNGPKAKSVKIVPAVIKACLDYGSFSGFGQWRNAGYGKYSYEILEDSGQEKN